MNIPHFDFGGDKQPLHFLHANGYPPECYQPLFELLQKQYHVFGMKLRPLWEDARLDDLKDWLPFTDDLLRFLSIYDFRPERSPEGAQSKDDPVIGVGHSIGGIVTLRTALRNPNKFRAIILLEPVLLVPSYLAIWKMMRAIRVKGRLSPLISGAKKRRRAFDDLETVFRGYRPRPIFRYMSDESLWAYIKGMTRLRTDGTYELAYSPEWEAHIYLTGLQDFDLWRDLPRLEVPTLIIRGAESDTFTKKAELLAKKKNPMIQVEIMQNATHILPLEHPQQAVDMINDFMNTL